MSASKTTKEGSSFIGFGCPPLSEWPHRVVVSIPANRTDDVSIEEDFGIQGDARSLQPVERCVLSRARWNAMAEVCKAELNARLREKKLPTSRWQAGQNVVDRILGAELLCLAYALGSAEEADVPAVVASWVALQSSERLWLAGRVVASSGDRARRGLALLMSAKPAEGNEGEALTPKKTSRVAKSPPMLPLFS